MDPITEQLETVAVRKGKDSSQSRASIWRDIYLIYELQALPATDVSSCENEQQTKQRRILLPRYAEYLLRAGHIFAGE
jgi:hypothetical protein